MHFEMDDFGPENFTLLKGMESDAQKWDLICRLAGDAGFDGIQISSTLYERNLGIDVRRIPSEVKHFRLTYHLGGLYDLSTSEYILFVVR